jgi:hypothetical protein
VAVLVNPWLYYTYIFKWLILDDSLVDYEKLDFYNASDYLVFSIIIVCLLSIN